MRLVVEIEARCLCNEAATAMAYCDFAFLIKLRAELGRAYSAFFDNGRLSKTRLDDLLSSNNVTTLFISGIAFDFCVSRSALDAAEIGYKVYVIEDATAGIAPETIESERQAMLDAGVSII